MRKFLILVLIVCSSTGFSQNKVVFQLQSINHIDTEGVVDTVNLVQPKSITIIPKPLSQVTGLAQVENHLIGVQIELLQSNLQNTRHLVLGLVFYKKKTGTQTWEFLSRSDHLPVLDVGGNLGKKGQLIAGHGFRLKEEGTDFQIFYHLVIN
jgi:hypothetical protein